MSIRFHFLLSVGYLIATSVLAQERPSFKFAFAPGGGEMPVAPDMLYSPNRSYGFEPGASVKSGVGGFITSDQPFLFSVNVPEGNYRVTVALGDPAGESTTTIKAELRRLMLQDIHTTKGQIVTREFVVNVRTPKIPGGGEVKLKDREKTSETMAWDDKLTLEFNGARPCISRLDIEPVDNAVTVFLLGDSTVCDQPAEPWASWGQMLPAFFKPNVAVANHAESGESMKSSLGAHRFEKVFSAMKPGDYLFIQYGHNDQKERGENLAFTTYKTDLKNAVAETRKRGGTPVLVTSMERKAGLETNTLGNYPEAVRQLAREENVALIDLNAMSRVFYRALGPDLGKAFQDGTHHNNYGAYELARCVLEGIRTNVPALAKFIRDDVAVFDPAHPDSPNSFHLPSSRQATATKPLGN